ncbi:hypothetical protein HQ520_16285 [bacterium]|nr:hypothetical protein [bacterium]
MPKYIAGQKKSAFEPIEVPLGGKTYVLKRVTGKVIRRIGQMSRDASEGNIDSVITFFEDLLGVPSAVMDEMDAVEIFEISRWFHEEIANQVQGKGPTGNPTPAKAEE